MRVVVFAASSHHRQCRLNRNKHPPVKLIDGASAPSIWCWACMIIDFLARLNWLQGSLRAFLHYWSFKGGKVGYSWLNNLPLLYVICLHLIWERPLSNKMDRRVSSTWCKGKQSIVRMTGGHCFVAGWVSIIVTKVLERKIEYKSSQSFSWDWINLIFEVHQVKSAACDKQNSCKKSCSSIYWCNDKNMLLLIFWATRIESSCSSIKEMQKILIERMIAHTIHRLHTRTTLDCDTLFIFCL